MAQISFRINGNPNSSSGLVPLMVKGAPLDEGKEKELSFPSNTSARICYGVKNYPDVISYTLNVNPAYVSSQDGNRAGALTIWLYIPKGYVLRKNGSPASPKAVIDEIFRSFTRRFMELTAAGQWKYLVAEDFQDSKSDFVTLVNSYELVEHPVKYVEMKGADTCSVVTDEGRIGLIMGDPGYDEFAGIGRLFLLTQGSPANLISIDAPRGKKYRVYVNNRFSGRSIGENERFDTSVVTPSSPYQMVDNYTFTIREARDGKFPGKVSVDDVNEVVKCQVEIKDRAEEYKIIVYKDGEMSTDSTFTSRVIRNLLIKVNGQSQFPTATNKLILRGKDIAARPSVSVNKIEGYEATASVDKDARVIKVECRRAISRPVPPKPVDKPDISESPRTVGAPPAPPKDVLKISVDWGGLKTEPFMVTISGGAYKLEYQEYGTKKELVYPMPQGSVSADDIQVESDNCIFYITKVQGQRNTFKASASAKSAFRKFKENRKLRNGIGIVVLFFLGLIGGRYLQNFFSGPEKVDITIRENGNSHPGYILGKSVYQKASGENEADGYIGEIADNGWVMKSDSTEVLYIQAIVDLDQVNNPESSTTTDTDKTNTETTVDTNTDANTDANTETTTETTEDTTVETTETHTVESRQEIARKKGQWLKKIEDATITFAEVDQCERWANEHDDRDLKAYIEQIKAVKFFLESITPQMDLGEIRSKAASIGNALAPAPNKTMRNFRIIMQKFYNSTEEQALDFIDNKYPQPVLSFKQVLDIKVY